MRFGQVLQNFGFVQVKYGTNPRDDVDYSLWVDEFYTEPWDVLKRIDGNG
jgi:hypothetical protein